MNTVSKSQVHELYKKIYNLSINMLHSPDEAEEATQNILLKIVEGLPSFRGESKFETWSFSIARNYLINYKQKSFSQPISFELFEQDVKSFSPYKGELGLSAIEERIYVEEVKVGCTLAMLQCLDKESRLVFILGNILVFPGIEAAEICGLTHTNYRKRLSRVKEKVHNFLTQNCGLINPDCSCRCRRRLLIALERGRIDLEKLLYQSTDKRISHFQQELNRAEERNIFAENPFFEPKDIKPAILKQLSILNEG